MLVTGHTGFKGSWLALWLVEMGAEVWGLADTVPTRPSHFEAVGLADLVHDRRADVTDGAAVAGAIATASPDIVFHLAAQSLVRRSYVEPVTTFATNVVGTANVLEASRDAATPAVLVATSDKCYANDGSDTPRREGDRLGGDDPYSASKAAAELVVAAFQRSYPEGPLVASARAGNVIGPADWSADRIVPDAIRAALGGRALDVRYPDARRPWQDVLDCLAGYLSLGERLLAGDARAVGPWNFGPEGSATVRELVEAIARRWPGGLSWRHDESPHPPEASTLVLDAAKARLDLGWAAKRNLAETADAIVRWHRAVDDGADARALSRAEIAAYAAAVAA